MISSLDQYHLQSVLYSYNVNNHNISLTTNYTIKLTVIKAIIIVQIQNKGNLLTFFNGEKHGNCKVESLPEQSEKLHGICDRRGQRETPLQSKAASSLLP